MNFEWTRGRLNPAGSQECGEVLTLLLIPNIQWKYGMLGRNRSYSYFLVFDSTNKTFSRLGLGGWQSSTAYEEPRLLPPDVITYLVPSCQAIYGNLGLAICSSNERMCRSQYLDSGVSDMMSLYSSDLCTTMAVAKFSVETQLILFISENFSSMAVSRTLQFSPFYSTENDFRKELAASSLSNTSL